MKGAFHIYVRAAYTVRIRLSRVSSAQASHSASDAPSACISESTGSAGAAGAGRATNDYRYHLYLPCLWLLWLGALFAPLVHRHTQSRCRLCRCMIHIRCRIACNVFIVRCLGNAVT